jgi:hypothetical protein
VRCDQGGAYASPGIPRLRLWEEALIASGRAAADYVRSYAGDESYRKYDVPLQTRSIERPLAAIYLLADSGTLEICKIEGAEAADMLFANTYRGAYVQTAGNPRAHWTACVQLVATTPIFRLSRSRDLARMTQDIPAILAHARANTQAV